ncbi:MAG: GIY-YIG nuclease family protein [Chthoniobacterales bacterium]|nr:GIY-YIG nuclease family protein [Chthoniobacterales bacterium]
MAKDITNEDIELLDELGVETKTEAAGGRSDRELRIIAGFEEVERFLETHGRKPEHGEHRDIFERIYAERLDRIRASGECREVLRDRDKHGLLADASAVATARVREEPDDRALLDELGAASPAPDDITRLVHVRPREEIKAAEEVARRNPCPDFAAFRPLFESVQSQLANGERHTLKYQDNAEVKKGDLFILDGQKLLVAEMGETFVSDYGRPDRRLRVVYDNGTESDLLLRSLQRALNKDKASRRISEPDLGPLFSAEEESEDFPSGHIYVLRSKSGHPFVAQNRNVLHKIGVTGGDVKRRIAHAAKDPTYLLSEVEIVATFKLSNINRQRLEALLHKFFAPGRLGLELKDRFGFAVEPKEWFLVPLPVIEEAIQKLVDGTIENYRYDQKTARLQPI